MDLVRSHFDLPPLFGEAHAAYAVLSGAGAQDPTDEMGRAISRYDEVQDAAVARSADQRESLWSYRELHNEAINATGVPHKLDVSVSPSRVPELVTKVEAWLADQRPDARGIYYGHLADGNVHVNVIGADRDDDAIDEAILTTVTEMGGSISAEHGVGQAKARWLHLSRSAGEIEKMRAVKRALDPRGILNLGKLLPPATP
jgi:FAD/FMN-containing dehydrogenase